MLIKSKFLKVYTYYASKIFYLVGMLQFGIYLIRVLQRLKFLPLRLSLNDSEDGKIQDFNIILFSKTKILAFIITYCTWYVQNFIVHSMK